MTIEVVHYKQTGELLTPADYAEKFDLPTIKVSADGDYVPSLEDIVKRSVRQDKPAA